MSRTLILEKIRHPGFVSTATNNIVLDNSGGLSISNSVSVGSPAIFSNTIGTGSLSSAGGMSWTNSNSPVVKSVRGKCWFQNSPSNSVLYNKIATLPASSVGTLDYLHLRVVVNKGWGAAQTGQYDIIMGLRNGFSATYKALKNWLTGNTSIVCYQLADDSIDVYARIASAFDYIQVDILSSNQCTIYEQSWNSTVPTGTIVFDTGSGTYPPDNYITGNGGIVLKGGAVTSSIGIAFPVTQSASTDPNTLDDYEEGSWTPSLVFSSGTATLSSPTGRYVKIGQQVTVWLFVQVANLNGSSGQAFVRGLPFTATSPSGPATEGGTFTVNYWQNLASNAIISGYTSNNNTQIFLVNTSPSTTTPSITAANFTNTSGFYGCVTYLTS